MAVQAIAFVVWGYGGFWRQHAWGNAIQFYRLQAGENQSVWCGPAYLFMTPVNTGIGMGTPLDSHNVSPIPRIQAQSGGCSVCHPRHLLMTTVNTGVSVDTCPAL